MTDQPAPAAEPRPLAELRDDARRILEGAIRETLELGARDGDRGSIPAYAIETVKSAAEAWLMLDAATSRAANAGAKPPPPDELAALVHDFIGNAPGLENATNLADHVLEVMAAAGVARGAAQ